MDPTKTSGGRRLSNGVCGACDFLSFVPLRCCFPFGGSAGVVGRVAVVAADPAPAPAPPCSERTNPYERRDISGRRHDTSFRDNCCRYLDEFDVICLQECFHDRLNSGRKNEIIAAAARRGFRYHAESPRPGWMAIAQVCVAL